MKEVFFAHNTENERKPREVTRSSAVFYFRCNSFMNTEIHFLNYWIIKRGISDVKQILTLRNLDGKLIKSFGKYRNNGERIAALVFFMCWVEKYEANF